MMEKQKRRTKSLKSGLSGSNRLPPTWKDGALPDELNPLILILVYITVKVSMK